MAAPPTPASSDWVRAPSARAPPRSSGPDVRTYQRETSTQIGSGASPASARRQSSTMSPTSVRPTSSSEITTVGTRAPDALGDHRDVAADPLQQVAGAGALDVGKRHVEGAAHHPLAQGGEHLLAEARHQHRAERREHRTGHERGEDAEREAVDDGR